MVRSAATLRVSNHEAVDMRGDSRQPENALTPHARFRHFGRAMRGFREFCGNGRGFRGRSPAWRLAAIAPCARPVESVYAELVHLLHFIHPGWAHPIGMVVRRLGDFR